MGSSRIVLYSRGRIDLFTAFDRTMVVMMLCRTQYSSLGGELGWHNYIPKVGVLMEQVNAAREDRKARAGGEDLGTLSNTFIYYLF